MSRFVLLLHSCPSSVPRSTHCDLMLEEGGVLRTWALAELPRGLATLANSGDFPDVSASDTVAAEALGDHRLAYLDFEGPLSGDRGRVRRLDAGTYHTALRTPEQWMVEASGQMLRGKLLLENPGAESTQWRLTYRSAV